MSAADKKLIKKLGLQRKVAAKVIGKSEQALSVLFNDEARFFKGYEVHALVGYARYIGRSISDETYDFIDQHWGEFFQSAFQKSLKDLLNPTPSEDAQIIEEIKRLAPQKIILVWSSVSQLAHGEARPIIKALDKFLANFEGDFIGISGNESAARTLLHRYGSKETSRMQAFGIVANEVLPFDYVLILDSKGNPHGYTLLGGNSISRIPDEKAKKLTALYEDMADPTIGNFPPVKQVLLHS